MSIVLQHRRGTTAQHAAFTGAAGELTFDTTKKTAVIHDGATPGGIPLAKESALILASAISGLTGESESSAPTTKFNLRADAVTTRDAAGRTKTYFSVATKQVDITVASAIGGRDQAGAFAAFAEPNFFFVPDGSGGLGLVASLANANTGPTGYAEWAIAASIKLNGSGQIIQGTVDGNTFRPTSLQQVVAGTSAFPASVSYANFVPASALAVIFSVRVSAGTNASGQGSLAANLSTNSSSSMDLTDCYVAAGNSFGTAKTTWTCSNLTARTLYYGSSSVTANVNTFSQTVYVSGWTMRNGAR